MRVGIYETVDVSDEQRALIAKELGQKTASRDDLKAWVWSMGKDWAQVLQDDRTDGERAADESEGQAAVTPGYTGEDDEGNIIDDEPEDLLGGDDDEESLI